VVAVAAVLASASAAAPAATTRGVWCEARSSVAWQRTLSHHIVSISRTTPLVPLALARDGRSFFATVYSKRFSGVAEIDAGTGRLTKIKAFPNPDLSQAGGAFDGRWLVWNEYHGFTSFDDFTTWAWDAKTRKVLRLGAATRSPGGQFWESPWREPDVRGGTATWVQGVGPDQLGEVHSYDLRSGRDLVVRHGHPAGAFLLDHHVLVWAEAPAPGVPTRMHAASALTGAPLPLPRALRRLRNVTGLQTDGRRIAYPDAHYRSLWWSSSPDSNPYEAVGTRHLDHVDNSVQVGGRYVGFGIQPRVFVGDTKRRRYVEITAHGGWTRVNGRSLLVLYATGVKALHSHAPIAFVPLRELPPMPACS
jgi:hypothetical protein